MLYEVGTEKGAEMNSPLLNAYKQGTKEYKIASENYEYGYRQGKADERAKCETCIHKVTKADIDVIENKARADEREKVLEEVKNIIERMYPPLAVDLMKALKKL